MASAKHSQDRTFWVLNDPTGDNDAVVTTDENEAFDMWAADTSWTAHAYNPIENWAMPVADEFQDRLDDERVEAKLATWLYETRRVA